MNCVCVCGSQGKLESFLTLAGQTLESFVKSMDGEVENEKQDFNSHEHQFVMALAGVVTSEFLDWPTIAEKDGIN